MLNEVKHLVGVDKTHRSHTSSPTGFLTCGLPPSRLGIKSKLFLPSTCRRFTPLRYVQNDNTVEIVSTELCAIFLSKAVLYNAQRTLGGRVVLDVLPVRTMERAAVECRFSRKTTKAPLHTFSSKGVSSGADMKLSRTGCTRRTARSGQ